MADLQIEAVFDFDALFDGLDDAIPKLIDGVEDFVDDVNDELNSKTRQDDSLLGLISGFVDDLNDISFPGFDFSIKDGDSDSFSDRFNGITDSVLQSLEDVFDYTKAVIDEADKFVNDIADVNIPFLESLDSSETEDFFQTFADLANDTVEDIFGAGVNIKTDESLELSLGDTVVEVTDSVSEAVDELLAINLFDDIKEAAESLPSLKLTVSASSGTDDANGEVRELIGTATVTPKNIGLDGETVLNTVVSFVL